MNDSTLAGRLRAATHDMHRVAEQSGVMRRLLRGQAGRDEYALLLRNLHALYAALEQALERNAAAPVVAPVRMPTLYRGPALAQDLEHFSGPSWEGLPLTPAMRAYVARIEEVSAGAPHLLAAHAYVRYLGDLSGGQMLVKVIRRSFGLTDKDGTAFYRFEVTPGTISAETLKDNFRAALNGLPLDAAAADAVVAEANAAFARHVALFAELDAQAAVAQGSTPPPAA